MAYDELWQVVRTIVSSRGRDLTKYSFFEELWRALIDKEKPLIILKAPTGSGKTEAILAPFLSQELLGDDRWLSLIHVLPTRSLVYNMFNRFCQAYKVLNSLIKRKYVVTYDYGGSTLLRPYLEGDVVTTTYDTLLYTFYGIRAGFFHRFRALGKIATSLVILDEVQLLQDAHWYATTLLPHHINNLIKIGARVVVMSATIPDILVKEISENVEEAGLHTITTTDEAKRGHLKVKLISGSLLEWLKLGNLDIKRCPKPMLIVCNMVKDACAIFTEVSNRAREELRVELLHSRLTAKTRSERESIAEGAQQNLVLVATQVVEAGLDGNFKTLLTEVAPIDALIQRLGRCARRSDGQAFVFLGDESAKAVYPECIIDGTKSLLTSSNIEVELGLCVKQVSPSLSLINQVYTESTIDELRAKVKDDLLTVCGYINAFFRKYIQKPRRLYEDVTSKLMRLGLELPCVYLTPEEVQNLKQGGAIGQLLLEDRGFSISIRPGEASHKLRIPSLEHQENDKRVYYVLKNAEPILKIEMHESLSEVLRRKSMDFYVIVNPQYYLVLEKPENEKTKKYEIGLRELYGGQ